MTHKEKRVARWYFGGLSSAFAACCTHPLDLLKVHLQTQQEGKLTLVQMAKNVVKTQGVFALYNGLSASLLRQLTYSTTRFGIYEVVKQKFQPDTFVSKVALAAGAGACGGFIGTPGDMVNVRMQNDIKLPKEKRRNYKHALDGLVRVYQEEGLSRLFSGASTATGRAIFMTIGQLSFYDQIKLLLLKSDYFGDTLTTHFLSSLSAGAIATSLTQPLDVLKTRAMNAKPGEFSSGICATALTLPIDVVKTRMMNSKPGEFGSLIDCIRYTASLGTSALYKGFVPSAIRIAPMTVIVFICFEQLTRKFGYIVI